LIGIDASPGGCIIFCMKWRAGRTTVFAALAAIVAGWGRIAFTHDFVLGGLLIGAGAIIAIRAFLYFRNPDA
jgi:hypothetical protein